MGKQTRPSRPTRRQKEEMKAWKLKPNTWLMVQDTPAKMELVSKSGLKNVSFGGEPDAAVMLDAVERLRVHETSFCLHWTSS